MGSLLQVDDWRVRMKIRDALEAAGGFGRPASGLLDDVNFLVTQRTDVHPVDENQLGRCIEWNLSKDYIRSKTDDDTDTVFWLLTPIGRAKQNESK